MFIPLTVYFIYGNASLPCIFQQKIFCENSNIRKESQKLQNSLKLNKANHKNVNS